MPVHAGRDGEGGRYKGKEEERWRGNLASTETARQNHPDAQSENEGRWERTVRVGRVAGETGSQGFEAHALDFYGAISMLLFDDVRGVPREFAFLV